MSAFDPLREFTTATCYADFRSCVLTAGELRAAVAEHDALRDAVRGYLATLPEYEVTPPCEILLACGQEAVGVVALGRSRVSPGGTRYVCAFHAVDYDPVAPLPPRVVTLRALAALVRS